MRDLTTSAIDRQNILNNLDAISNIQEYLGVKGMLFYGEYRFTKEQVADFYKVDTSTIDSYLSQYEKELKHNGYELFKGKKLKTFKDEFGGIINIQSKTTQLGLLNFRTFLNLGMLLVESEMAKAEGLCSRTERQRGDQRRRAGSASDPGSWRRLHPKKPRCQPAGRRDPSGRRTRPRIRPPLRP